MNWSKAKNILIIVLIITNLIIWLLLHNTSDIKNQNTDEAVKEYTVSVLEDNGIYLEDMDFPENVEKMSSLTVKYENEKMNGINKELTNSSFTINDEPFNEETLRKATEEYLEKNGLSGNAEFERAEINGNNARVIYKEQYNNIPVEECALIFYFTDRQLTGFEGQWVTVTDESGNKREVISAVDALLKFMELKKGEKPINISSIKIVYYVDAYDSEFGVPISDTVFPAWQITYNDGQREYISAFMQ